MKHNPLAPSGSLLRRRDVLATGALALISVASFGQSRTWPSKPIRLVFPFPVGGSGGYVAHEVAERLSRLIGGTMYVESVAGANGNIGVTAVANAVPDAHTLLITSSSIVLSPHLYANPGYQMAGLTPVGATADIPFGLLVHSSVPARNLSEFRNWLGERQGKAFYASAGNGNLTFLAMHMLLTQLGLNATHVPYKGGAPAIAAVLTGEPQFTIADLQVTKGHVESGRLRLLAVTGAQRSPMTPDTPTIAESGVPGYVADGWMGMFAPAGVPAEVVAMLGAELEKVVQEPDYQSKLQAQGLRARRMPPAEFKSFVQAESKRWGEAIRSSGARLD